MKTLLVFIIFSNLRLGGFRLIFCRIVCHDMFVCSITNGVASVLR